MDEDETPVDDTSAGGAETPTEPTSLGDAISAAIEPTLPPTDETPADENADSEGTADDESLEGDEGTETDEDGASADESGKPRGADGRFKTPDGKAADGTKQPDGKPGDKKQDPVNDPIPEDLKGKTRERMTQLIDTVKAKDEIIGNQGVIIEAVKATGASPEEFANSIKYMGLVRSDKPEDLKAARDMIMLELEEIALKLGESTPGVDFLKGHPDLQEMVNNGQITQDIAEETARLRTANTRKAEATARNLAKEHETAQSAAQERTSATSELNELGQTLSENDPLFEEKMKLMPDLKALGASTPPKQWKGAFMAAYKAAGVQLAKGQGKANQQPGQRAGTPLPKGQPLRANKSPSGGQGKQPSNILEAVTAAIQSAG